MDQSTTVAPSAEQFMARFIDFKSRYEKAREKAEIDTRQSAPGFNIFHFLNNQRLEQFHSDFMAHLLNPRANHRQGHLFLQTFFKTIASTPSTLCVPDVAMLAHGSWLIQREVITGDGNLDIVLRNPALKALYAIENKIDADEQPDQLARYAAYLERQKKIICVRAYCF